MSEDAVVTRRRDVQYVQLCEALTLDGCPICAFALMSVYRYLDHFLYEFVNDPWVRAELVESRGFCTMHSAQLLGFRDPTGVAIVYGHMLQEFREALRDACRRYPAGLPAKTPWRRTRAGGELRRTLEQWRTPRVLCPACQIQRNTEDSYMSRLLRGLAYEDFLTSYRASSGICVPHLLQALRRCTVPEQVTRLLDAEEATLEALQWELSELVRKVSYEFQHEPRGHEQTSWQRVIEKLYGRPGMVWPGQVAAVPAPTSREGPTLHA
ncbi:MAG: hypothetical protein HY660_06020 [Armatimonadetes bacterium]|nr:hypothetical protein [Armatimonadota bacterium]